MDDGSDAKPDQERPIEPEARAGGMVMLYARRLAEFRSRRPPQAVESPSVIRFGRGAPPPPSDRIQVVTE